LIHYPSNIFSFVRNVHFPNEKKDQTCRTSFLFEN
jgi:hypothetical protein